MFDEEKEPTIYYKYNGCHCATLAGDHVKINRSFSDTFGIGGGRGVDIFHTAIKGGLKVGKLCSVNGENHGKV